MNTARFAVDLIQVPQRLRSRIDQDRVSALSDSMSKIGLMTPITVHMGDSNEPILVAGRHRLLAAKKLGWNGIDCIISIAGETERRLWEIAENLHRSELTALERDEHIDEWRRLTEVRKNSAPSNQQPKDKGVRETARELGVDEKAVRNATKVASITPEAKAAAKGAKLDNNQSALLKVADAPKERQVEEVRRLADAKAGAAKPVVSKPMAVGLRRELTDEEKAEQSARNDLVQRLASLIRSWRREHRQATDDLIYEALEDLKNGAAELQP